MYSTNSFALLEEAYELTRAKHQEQLLISEANKIISYGNKTVLTESAIAAIDSAATKWFEKVISFVNTAKQVSAVFVDKFWKMVDFLLKKLSLDKQSTIERNIQKLGNQLSNTIQAGIDKETIGKAVKTALNNSLSEGLIDKQNIKNSFKSNKSAIFAKIKNEISKELQSLKQNVENDLETFQPEVQPSLSKKIIGGSKNFAAGMSFMTAFGFIDNLGLFVGMSAVEDWIISLGFDSIVAAGIGNTFSDVVGIFAGGFVTAFMIKVLKIKSEGTFIQQLLGVIAGCMIPVIARIIWMSLSGG